jgi:hypothetical protein
METALAGARARASPRFRDAWELNGAERDSDRTPLERPPAVSLDTVGFLGGLRSAGRDYDACRGEGSSTARAPTSRALVGGRLATNISELGAHAPRERLTASLGVRVIAVAVRVARGCQRAPRFLRAIGERMMVGPSLACHARAVLCFVLMRFLLGTPAFCPSCTSYALRPSARRGALWERMLFMRRHRCLYCRRELLVLARHRPQRRLQHTRRARRSSASQPRADA